MRKRVKIADTVIFFYDNQSNDVFAVNIYGKLEVIYDGKGILENPNDWIKKYSLDYIGVKNGEWGYHLKARAVKNRSGRFRV